MFIDSGRNNFVLHILYVLFRHLLRLVLSPGFVLRMKRMSICVCDKKVV